MSRLRGAPGLFALALLGTALAVTAVMALLIRILLDGFPGVDGAFLTGFPSRDPGQAGVLAGIGGTLWMLVLPGLLAIPLGVAGAVYLEEYAPDRWYTRLVRLNIANLAGVPSVVYGILGLALFVRGLGLGPVVLAGGLTLAILILPMVLLTSQEAIRGVPFELREAAYALGCTRWQVVRHHVLPLAWPGIATGGILALARAAGETAPLVMIGAMGLVTFVPVHPGDAFTTLSLQAFEWVLRPQPGFQDAAASAIVLLLLLVLLLHVLAAAFRRSVLREA